MQENKDFDENPEIFAFRSSTVREERRMSDFDLWDMLLFGARRPKIKTPPVVVPFSRVRRILSELGAHKFRSTPLQALQAWNVEKGYAWSSFIINHLEVQSTFLADIDMEG
ncbi:hypothetical protein AVEN_128111-1 [Araneus ventricosus]|uniref:Uncharacterized protein n=1 Tax=Araneus ventricosus TaxID=182803 RepID=A0A4Y2A0U7_ARAVE|nr:hypothetical protein AVEN_128111-1 [Araneus ventricosus]